MDTPATENCKNKTNNTNYDRPDDDNNNNNDDDDVDCFPRQDKQHVLQQQDISMLTSSQYCCTIYFDWCIRQTNAPSSTITLLVVSIYYNHMCSIILFYFAC